MCHGRSGGSTDQQLHLGGNSSNGSESTPLSDTSRFLKSTIQGFRVCVFPLHFSSWQDMFYGAEN